MSREIPILFRDELVRTILAGKKTVTRRIGTSWAKAKAGDRLWVRETWRIDRRGSRWVLDYRSDTGAPLLTEISGDRQRDAERIAERGPWVYVDGLGWRCDGRLRWHPSIHMPRWACRLELEIVSVTPQRMVLGGGLGQMAVLLPDVDDDEARREGIGGRGEFLDLWRSIHADLPGDTTVYRVEFRRLP